MARSLVIVESPAKASTLGKFLGKDFAIKATYGHIKDLPKSKMGVDPEENFKPHFTQIKGKTKVIDELKKAAAAATEGPRSATANSSTASSTSTVWRRWSRAASASALRRWS